MHHDALSKTLIAILQSAKGSRELIVSLQEVAIQAGSSRETVRDHLAELQRREIIRLKRPANSYIREAGRFRIRHPATYLLNRTKFRQFAQQASPETREKLFFPCEFPQSVVP